MPVKEIMLQVSVIVSYDNLEVEKITVEVTQEVRQTVSVGVPEFQPFIHYQSFEDFSIHY